MMAVFNRFDGSLEEAARDMGASEWTVFKEVTLPLITPGIVAAGLFGFTLSYDEFARTTLLAGESADCPAECDQRPWPFDNETGQSGRNPLFRKPDWFPAVSWCPEGTSHRPISTSPLAVPLSRSSGQSSRCRSA